MRFEWFLPVLRKTKAGEPSRSGRRLMRLWLGVLPTGFFSNGETKQRGLVRRILQTLGRSWLASPWRRLIQTIALATFWYLFFCVCWPYSAQPVHLTPGKWPSHYADNLAQKETIAAEVFLTLDPLVSLSTAIASRVWVWSLGYAGVLLLVCLVVPRGFCGYLCPLGTLIDLFDWSIGKRVTRFRVLHNGWWIHIKYYLLLGTLMAAGCGVLLTGFVSAIPVVTRGLFFTLAPIQTGIANGWHQIPPRNVGYTVSLGLFAIVFGLGFLKPRFWCRYICPSGAIFSIANLARVSERTVAATCIECGKCVDVCSFGAIQADYTTRGTDCTFCQTCGGVCPVEAVHFTLRWRTRSTATEDAARDHEDTPGRRRFLSASMGIVAATVSGVGTGLLTKTFGAVRHAGRRQRPIRPPGSVPEREFLQMCIRCAECFKVCPSDVLQPQGFRDQGLEGLWTPHVVADWAGCASSCNACGQVCPTGAIRALPLEEKKAARIGLAVVNEQTCLPFAGRDDCQLCVDECQSAGYQAIEFRHVGTEADEDGNPIEDTGYLAPIVLAEKCVGCGLCQTRCFEINVTTKGLLKSSAIVIETGDGKEDRLMRGSYIALREAEERERERQRQRKNQQRNLGTKDSYLPDFLQ